MRTIIQVCLIPDSRLADRWITQALCDDGSLWIMSDAKRTWFPLPPIPQDATTPPPAAPVVSTPVEATGLVSTDEAGFGSYPDAEDSREVGSAYRCGTNLQQLTGDNDEH